MSQHCLIFRQFLSSMLIISAFALTVGTVQAATLKQWVIDAAGGSSVSSNYRNLSVVGQPTPLGTAGSSGYRNYPGFLHSVAAEGHLLPDYTLSLVFAGSGSGMVTSSPAGIQCNIDCSAVFNAYIPVTLTPAADAYMIFSGWSGGGCTGTVPCSITLNGTTAVTATFDKDADHAVFVPGSTPDTGTYYTSLQAAYDAAPVGSTIKAWATTYSEELNCNDPKAVILKGGYDQTYSNQIGYTSLDGTFIFSQGTTTIERITIK